MAGFTELVNKSGGVSVQDIMLARQGRSNGFRQTQVCIYLGAAVFLIALLVSATLVPELRILHSFQSLIYVAVIVLARRNSAWGYGAGCSIAILWNSVGLFITHLIQAGAIAFLLLLRTGHAGSDPVPMAVMLGSIGHFILVFATLLAMIRFNTETRKWWKFAGGSALSLAYFALLVVFFQPH